MNTATAAFPFAAVLASRTVSHLLAATVNKGLLVFILSGILMFPGADADPRISVIFEAALARVSVDAVGEAAVEHIYTLAPFPVAPSTLERCTKVTYLTFPAATEEPAAIAAPVVGTGLKHLV